MLFPLSYTRWYLAEPADLVFQYQQAAHVVGVVGNESDDGIGMGVDEGEAGRAGVDAGAPPRRSAVQCFQCHAVKLSGAFPDGNDCGLHHPVGLTEFTM